MRRHTKQSLPMLGATLVVVLSLVAGTMWAITHFAAVGILEGALLAVVGALAAAFLIGALVTALMHARRLVLAAA